MDGFLGFRHATEALADSKPLAASWSATADGRGGLVVVEGEAGIGKSRLLSAWADGVRAAGGTVLSGRCEELALGLPLSAAPAAIAAS